MEFDGKRALVTGSSGMGLASALRLARDGAEVHLCGIDAGLNAAAASAAAALRPASMPQRCTSAPSRARRSAEANPMPLDPVTRARLPSNSMLVSSQARMRVISGS